MTQSKFANHEETDQKTLLGYTSSKMPEVYKMLNQAWESLGGKDSELEEERKQKIALHNKDGAQIYNKFFKSSLAYEHRAPDTLSKMLGMSKPCCAAYIDMDRKKICLSFNDTLAESRQGVIIEKWNKIVEASKAMAQDFSSKKLDVLSETLYMQEYKIVDKYLELSLFLEKQIDKIGAEFPYIVPLTNLSLSLIKYNNLITDYRNDFNKPTAIRFPDHTFLIAPLKELISKSGAQMPVALLPWIDNTDLSVCFIKMRSLFEHLIRSIPDEYQDVQRLLLSKFDEFDKTFYKAFDDILKITTKYLKDSEIADFTLEFIPNPHKIHAELIMLEHRAKMIALEQNPSHDPNEFIKLTPAIFDPQHLGVSKLSCVQCYFTYEFAGLINYVRGGHGILFLQQWNFPQHWEMQKAVEGGSQSLLTHLSERLISAIQYYNERGMKLPDENRVHNNPHSACISDDEEDAADHKHMTYERYEIFRPSILERFLDFVEGVLSQKIPATAAAAALPTNTTSSEYLFPTSPSSESTECQYNPGSPTETTVVSNSALAAAMPESDPQIFTSGSLPPPTADFLG